MGDKYDQCPPDEISLFVRQILLRSSSSAASSSFVSRSETPFVSFSAAPPMLRDEAQGGVGRGVYFSGTLSSSSPGGGGAPENDNIDECDCEAESEDGIEALVDEVPAKAAPPRSSSKRSRAAEVHNLSEKRRRSRINEKMKALQNLIPNSNKTDKASMLDEAIEYLKQLQLQVQMLSLRNGISLRPMCLPGLLQPIQHAQSRMGSGEENGSHLIDVSRNLPLHQESAGLTTFSHPNEHASSTHLSVPNMSSMIISETSSGLESSILAHYEPFVFHIPSEENRREDVLFNPQLNTNHSKSNLSDFEMGVTTATAVALPFGTESSYLKDGSPLEACILGRDEMTEDALEKNAKRNLMPSPATNHEFRTGRNADGVENKMARHKIY